MEPGLPIDHKIKALYPDMVRYQVHVDSAYDDSQNIWRVKFSKGKYVLETVLEATDVELLMSGKRCLSLTVELQQMSDSLTLLGLLSD